MEVIKQGSGKGFPKLFVPGGMRWRPLVAATLPSRYNDVTDESRPGVKGFPKAVRFKETHHQHPRTPWGGGRVEERENLCELLGVITNIRINKRKSAHTIVKINKEEIDIYISI